MSKKALLVVSFGTSYPETRQRTIEAIEAHLDKAFPDRDMVRAWTSNFIIKKVARDQGIAVHRPEEALFSLAEAGYTDVLVQPTHLTDGFENRRLREILKDWECRFDRLRLGRPLLCLPEDKAELVGILDAIYPRQEGEALVLMGHGSEDRPTPDYEELNSLMQARQGAPMVVGTVEGEPGLRTVEECLAERGGPERQSGSEERGVPEGRIRTLVLAPLMIVAGDHANNDLAGEGPDSWKSILEGRGYATRVSMQGLGEFREIRDMFARHAAEAVPLEEWQ